VSQVLAKSSTHLDQTLGTLNQALVDVKGFLQQNNSTLIGTVNKLNDLTKVLSDQSEDIEQVLHVAGPGIANFYNIYDPAQGTLNGLISLPNSPTRSSSSAADPSRPRQGCPDRSTTSVPKSAGSGWAHRYVD